MPRNIQHEPLAVRRVRDFIQANYADNVSLDDLSACSGLSPFHLLRTFRRAIGMPPHAYLRQIRVEQAKQLLAVGTPIAEAAAAAGFVDQSHLNRLFKKILGMTPGAYAAGRDRHALAEVRAESPGAGTGPTPVIGKPIPPTTSCRRQSP